MTKFNQIKRLEKEKGMNSYRIVWVDMLKVFCMLTILWFHTEMYYAGRDITPYELYVEDVLAMFFFLTGYVTRNDAHNNWKKLLWSVFRWLFVPYLFFTSLIAFPKALVHHTFDGVLPISVDILSGHASWFISALIVVRLIHISVTFFTGSSTKVISISSIMALLLSGLIGNAESPWHYESDFWCVNEGLLGYSLMAAGMMFKRYEGNIVKHLYQPLGFAILFILVLISKYVVLSTNAKMVFGPVIVSNYFLFLFDLMVFILFFIGIFMKLRPISILEWVGKRSIVYYFFCGGCPLLVSICLNRIGFNYTCYAQISVAFVLAVCFSSALVFIVYRYTNIVRKI